MRRLMDLFTGRKTSRLDRELEAVTTDLHSAKQRNRAAAEATEEALEDFLRANEELQLSFTSYKIGRH